MLRALRRGDTVASFSPSFPVTAREPARHDRARAFLQAQGLHFRPGQLTGADDHYRSGTARERADELNALLRDPQVRCIMSTIGGTNSNALLPYLDYAAFRRNPKIVTGYSDATAILLALHAQTGVPVFYGPALVASLGEFPPLVDETWAAFMRIAGEAHAVPCTLEAPPFWTEEFIPWATQDRAKTLQPNHWRTVSGGRARGRLIGGNMNALYGIIASPYFPEPRDGDILLLEESMKDAATVEKNFTMLALAGLFDRAGAIVLGKFEGYADLGSGRRPDDILREVLDGRTLPILADVDCGHTHPMLTLPIGVEVEVDADRQRITILQDWRTCAPHAR